MTSLIGRVYLTAVMDVSCIYVGQKRLSLSRPHLLLCRIQNKNVYIINIMLLNCYLSLSLSLPLSLCLSVSVSMSDKKFRATLSISYVNQMNNLSTGDLFKEFTSVPPSLSYSLLCFRDWTFPVISSGFWGPHTEYWLRIGRGDLVSKTTRERERICRRKTLFSTLFFTFHPSKFDKDFEEDKKRGKNNLKTIFLAIFAHPPPGSCYFHLMGYIYAGADITGPDIAFVVYHLTFKTSTQTHPATTSSLT